MRDLSSLTWRTCATVALTVAGLALTGCGPKAPTDGTPVPAVSTAAATSVAVPANVTQSPPITNPAVASPNATVAQVGQPVPAAPSTFRAPAPDDGARPLPAPQANPPPPVQANPSNPAPVAQAAPAPAPRVVSSALRGQISSIEAIHEKPPGTGAGAVIGGVLGAVVGNQFGHGNGRAAMTVVGAAGGALAGNTVERKVNERIVGYRIGVRLDNGQTRIYQEPTIEGMRIGDRVRIEGKRIRRV